MPEFMGGSRGEGFGILMVLSVGLSLALLWASVSSKERFLLVLTSLPWRACSWALGLRTRKRPVPWLARWGPGPALL